MQIVPLHLLAFATSFAMVGICTGLALNLAIAEIPVPLVVLLFAGLITAFAGVALALNVDFTAAQMKGVWLALAGALAWSATFLLTSHFFRGRDPRPATLHIGRHRAPRADASASI